MSNVNLYQNARLQDAATYSYPGAINLLTGDSAIANPYILRMQVECIQNTDHTNLPNLDEHFLRDLRLFAAQKFLGEHAQAIPSEEFQIAESTFGIFEEVLRNLSRFKNFPDGNFEVGWKNDTVAIIPQGAYSLYSLCAGKVLGHIPNAIFMPRTANSQFKLTPDTLEIFFEEQKVHLQEKAALLVLENPTILGHVYNEEELLAISDVCRSNGCYIFTDEVYRETVYDNSHVSLLSASKHHDHIISVLPLSKSYGNLQNSLALARMPASLKFYVSEYLGRVFRTTTSMHIAAAKAIMGNDQETFLKKAREVYQDKTEFVCNLIRELAKKYPHWGIELIHKPQAGYSAAFTIREIDSCLLLENPERTIQASTSLETFDWLAGHYGVKFYPLFGCGIDNHSFRVVYGSASSDTIAEGFRKMEEALLNIQQPYQCLMRNMIEERSM
jgi:aspartate/methionine/tyrosine aminotransferase